MNESTQLLGTLKRQLKAQGMTYRDLAEALGVSEVSVKRMFSSGRFSIDRIVEISHFLGFTLAELAQEAAVSENRLHTLTESQEKELVADEKLLLVAVCVLNQWEIKDIVAVYRLGEAECIHCLIKLDRLRLLSLLPNNRIRLNVARDFDWRPLGPIRSYFLSQGLGEFLKCDFSQSDELMSFSHAMLTESAMLKLQVEMRKLRHKISELHQESLSSPLARRRGTGILLALREWELGAFTSMRRTG